MAEGGVGRRVPWAPRLERGCECGRCCAARFSRSKDWLGSTGSQTAATLTTVHTRRRFGASPGMDRSDRTGAAPIAAPARLPRRAGRAARGIAWSVTWRGVRRSSSRSDSAVY
eukprot:359787-Chlamydomonas_euryale.AAC.7